MKRKCWEIWYEEGVYGLHCKYIFAKTKYKAVKMLIKEKMYLRSLEIKSIKEIVL